MRPSLATKRRRRGGSQTRRAWDRWCEDAAEQLQRAFGTRVSVSQESATGGRISLRWYSFEQLEYLVERLASATTEGADGTSEGAGRITV